MYILEFLVLVYDLNTTLILFFGWHVANTGEVAVNCHYGRSLPSQSVNYFRSVIACHDIQLGACSLFAVDYLYDHA